MTRHHWAPIGLLALAVGAWSCSSATPPEAGAETNGGTGDGGSGGKASGGSGGKSTGGSGGKSAGGSGGQGNGGSPGTGGSSDGGSPGTGGTATGGSGDGGSMGGADGGSSGSDAGADTAMGTGGSMGGAFTVMGDFMPMGNFICFKDGATLNTGGKSPAIMWDGLPAGTMSIAVSLKDLSNNGVHWVIWNLPPTTKDLPAGFPTTKLPTGASQSNGWYGPGATLHKYEYQVWALKVAMLPANSAKAALYNTILPMQKIESTKIIVCGDRGAKCADCSKL